MSNARSTAQRVSITHHSQRIHARSLWKSYSISISKAKTAILLVHCVGELGTIYNEQIVNRKHNTTLGD